MSSRTATPLAILSAGDRPVTLTGLVVPVTLSADGQDQAAPTTIQITPRGRVRARDGRQFTFNPEALAARFAADGIEIPVDLDHSSAQSFAEPRVAGWIRSVEARPEGLFASVDWLPAGIEALAARSRRYVSPAIRHTDDGTAIWIHSAALVAAPALAMPALAHADPKEHSMTSIAQALGLDATASEEALLSALTTRLEGTVSKAVHDAALAQVAELGAQLETARGELAALAAAGHQQRVDAVLDAALKARKILPAQRAHFATLAATPAGLDQVDALLRAMPVLLAASGLGDIDPPEADPAMTAAGVTALAAEISAEIADKAKAGVTVDPAAALAAIKARKAKA